MIVSNPIRGRPFDFEGEGKIIFGSKYLFSLYSRLNHLFLYRPNQIIFIHFCCILKSGSELILGSIFFYSISKIKIFFSTMSRSKYLFKKPLKHPTPLKYHVKCSMSGHCPSETMAWRRQWRTIRWRVMWRSLFIRKTSGPIRGSQR